MVSQSLKKEAHCRSTCEAGHSQEMSEFPAWGKHVLPPSPFKDQPRDRAGGGPGGPGSWETEHPTSAPGNSSSHTAQPRPLVSVLLAGQASSTSGSSHRVGCHVCRAYHEVLSESSWQPRQAFMGREVHSQSLGHCAAGLVTLPTTHHPR